MNLPSRIHVANARRRNLLIACGLLVAAPPAFAQARTAKVPRIGVLQGSSPTAFPHLLEAFRQGLRELGYVEGRTVGFEYRWANGKLDELHGLARELARLDVDLLFAAVTPAALAAKAATTTIPIVFAQVNDPVGTGLVSSLARPGGNVTGVSTNNLELIGKRLELLKEVSPRSISRVALLFNPADASNVLAVKETERQARILGMEFKSIPVKTPEELPGAFATLAVERIDALSVAAGALTNSHAGRIAALAAEAKILAVYGSDEFADAGGLMSYAADFRESHRLAAAYVDKILKGGKPGDLPVEQMNKYTLVINRKAAHAQGIRIPPSVLLRAGRVIE
jgi:putative ABC transport system substrate-binding protein